jgi:hypothetical protein
MAVTMSEIARVLHFGSIQGLDDLTNLEARLGGWALRLRAGHQGLFPLLHPGVNSNPVVLNLRTALKPLRAPLPMT